MEARFAAVGLVFALLTACSPSLEHDAAWDPQAPFDKQARATLAGHIMLEGERDHAQIGLELQNASRTYSATTKPDGSVMITGVVPGAYTLTIGTRYFVPVTENVVIGLGQRLDLGSRVLRARLGSVTGKALGITVVGHAQRTEGGVAVRLEKTGSIRARAAAAPAWRPLSAVELANTYTAVSTPEGDYSFAGVPVGEYAVRASSASVAETVVATVSVTGEEVARVGDIALTPLTGFFSVEGEAGGVPSAAFTATPAVTLRLTGLGAAVKMRVGLAAAGGICVPGAAEALAAVKPMTLAAEGENVFCVRFVDQGGNETETLTERIVYDATPPVNASVRINNGAAAAGTNLATLDLSAVDSGSGVAVYKRSPVNDFSGAAALPFVSADVISLAVPNAQNTVWVTFGDRAGNFSAPVSASILWDEAPPAAASVQVRRLDGTAVSSGDTIREGRVVLASAVSDLSPLELQVSTTGSFAGQAWEPYSAFKTIDIAASATLAARVRDQAGHVVDLLAGFALTYDATPPVLSFSRTTAALTRDAFIGLSAVLSETGEVQVSADPTFGAAAWIAATAVTGVTLEAGDGLRAIYARGRDAAGNVSETRSVSVTLDQTPPQPADFAIAGGPLTKELSVSLTFNAGGATKYRVAEGACAGAYTGPLPAGVSFSFATTTDGAKDIAVQFADDAGNESACVLKTVTLDRTPPLVAAGGIQISGGALYTTTTFVELALAAEATEMMLANGASLGGAAWEPYRALTSWFLPQSAGEIERTVSVMFRDAAGNESAVYADTITLDSQAPSGPAVAIDAGAPYATTTAVTLTLSAAGATLMQLSNDGFFDTEPVLAYATSAAWSLQAGDGVRMVYARFLDAAGNTSPVVSAYVTLDQTPPQSPAFSIEEAPQTPLLTVHLALAALGAVEMRIAEGACGGAWVSYAPAAAHDFASPLDGVKTLAVQFRDAAGNTTVCLTQNVTLDSTLPLVTSMAPRSGWVGRGVTIDGLNFGQTQGASRVTFGGVTAAITAWSNAEILAQVPPFDETGSQAVVVTIDGRGSRAVSFIVTPGIRQIDAPYGRGGETFTLTGTTFGTAQGAVAVAGLAAGVVSWSTSSVRFVAPAGTPAGRQPVVLTAASGLRSPGYSLGILPQISSLTPTSGGAGTLIGVTGASFGASRESNRIVLGGAEAQVKTWSDTYIQVTAPAGVAAGTVGLLLVADGDLSSNAKPFQYLAPRVSKRSPGLTTAGATITLTGARLGASPGSVTLGGVSASVQNWSATAVTVTVPALAAGRRDAWVNAAGQSSNRVGVWIRGNDMWYANDVPTARSAHSAVWTGSEMVVWGGQGNNNGATYYATGGRYDPAADSWLPVTTLGAPAARAHHVAVWTGTEMFIAGITNSGSGDGELYDPATDAWRKASGEYKVWSTSGVWTGQSVLIFGWQGTSDPAVYRYDPATDHLDIYQDAAAPAYRYGHSAVWTGAEMVIWGGQDSNAGGRYDPKLNRWRATSTTAAPTGRTGHSAVWTGSEMLVWGGESAGTLLNTGARYDPKLDLWTALPLPNAPAARKGHVAVWNGGIMLVWGGTTDAALLTGTNTGAFFNPGTNAWVTITVGSAPAGRMNPTAVWTGTELVVWGGEAGTGSQAYVESTGGRYNPSSMTWRSMTTSAAPAARSAHNAVWTGTQMLVWGGKYPDGTAQVGGGKYTPATDSWLPINPAAYRFAHSMVWTGSEMIVWGGVAQSGGMALATGQRYSPGSNAWTNVSATAAPSGRAEHTAVWSSAQMIVWGGSNYESQYHQSVFASGGRYAPVSDTWYGIATTNAVARVGHSAVWAGSEMIVWGGSSGGAGWPANNTGERYPASNAAWTALPTAGAPAARTGHAAVWDGTYMTVFGGGVNPGGRFFRTAGTWLAMASTPLDVCSNAPTVTLAGSAVVVFGGLNASLQPVACGGRYYPATDAWASLNRGEWFPSPRSGHSAVWTGSEMLVYGGSPLNADLAYYLP